MEYILFSFILAGLPTLYTGYCNKMRDLIRLFFIITFIVIYYINKWETSDINIGFGVVNLDNDETWRCKYDAKNFLTQLLCDGIHISYTHYWLMEDFYNIIESLINFIDKNDSGEICKNLSGNYEGTRIDVYIYN